MKKIVWSILAIILIINGGLVVYLLTPYVIDMINALQTQKHRGKDDSARDMQTYPGHAQEVPTPASKKESGNANANLLEAAKKGDVGTAQIALQAGAEIDRNSSGTTALIIAAQKGHTDMVRFLLEQQCHVNVSAGGGFTALMNAAYYGHTEIVKLLLAYGADVKAQGSKGQTALSLARKKGHTEIVDLLENSVQEKIVQQSMPDVKSHVTLPPETPKPTPVTSQLSLTQGQKKDIRVRIKEISLGEVQSGIIQESFVVSPDNRRVAYVVKQDSKMFVVVNGKEGRPYVNLAIPIFSSDSQRVAYGAMHDDYKEIIVVDGQEGEPYDKIMEGPFFSPDSQRVAYVAERGDKQFVVVDAQEGQVYDEIGKNSFRFSLDSQWFVYVAIRDDKMLIVMNGKEGQAYDGIGEDDLIFSPDSQRIAYIAFQDDKQVVVVDGQEGQPYDMIGDLIFSPDSQRVAYVGMHIRIRDNKYIIVLDGEEIATYDAILAGSLMFSPDSQRVAYVAKRGDKQVAVVDGHEGQVYDGIGENSLKFSPDSQRIAYGAIQGGKFFIVIDGQEGQAYDGIGENALIFSPDSQRVAYMAGHAGKKAIVVNEKKGKSYDEIFVEPIFSLDSQRIAYVAGQRGKQVVVVDSQEGQAYDAIRNGSLVFSPDSKRLMYMAKQGNRQFITIDGQEMKSYDAFITNLQFNSPTSFHTLVFQGIEVIRIEGEIVETGSEKADPKTSIITASTRNHYNISRDIGEEVFEEFVMTELTSLFSIFLNQGSYPGEKVSDLMTSKDLTPFFVGEAQKLLEEWGPDIARLSPEEMPENMRKALERFRKAMRENAEKRLADLNLMKKYDLQNDIGQELMLQFIEREITFLLRSLEDRGFLKEKIEELLMSKEFMVAFTALKIGLLERWGPDMAKLSLEQMSEDMRNALEKSRENIREHAEENLADSKIKP